MSLFYGRQFELYVGEGSEPFIAATNDRQFRVVFNVLIDYGAFNSYADIAIYNLSRDTEAKVFERDQPIQFKAGYQDNLDFIFNGQIRNILREKFGPDRITRIICRSADKAVSSASINQSFEENVEAPAIIKACADAMELPLTIKNEDFTGQSPYASGYTLATDPKTALNKLAKAHEFQWLVDNERLVVVGNDSFRDGAVNEISALTGMVGSPEITEVGCDVTKRLDPSVRMGGRFKINSEFAIANFGNVFYQEIPTTIGQGTYNIQRINHTGDSWGDDWNTKLIGLAEDVAPA